MFEGDPSTLNERTETPCKEGDVLVGDMAFDGVKCFAGAMIVIKFSSVRHDGFKLSGVRDVRVAPTRTHDERTQGLLFARSTTTTRSRRRGNYSTCTAAS
jgi:hypothetical protein